MRRKLLKIGVTAGGVVLVIVVAFGGLYLAFTQNFKADPPAAEYAKPKSALEAQHQDLDYFRKAMALDRSFSPTARAEAGRRIAVLQQFPRVLPQQKLHVALMQIMALADNGHTRMRSSITGKTVLMAPVRVARFAEGFFVMRAKAPWRDMLGGRVEAIDGMPFQEVLQRLETLRGGTEAFRRENAAVFITVHDLLYGLGIARDADRSRWTVRMPDGHTVSKILFSVPETTVIFPDGARWRSPAPLPGMGRDWISAQPASQTLPLKRAEHGRTLFPRAGARKLRDVCAH